LFVISVVSQQQRFDVNQHTKWKHTTGYQVWCKANPIVAAPPKKKRKRKTTRPPKAKVAQPIVMLQTGDDENADFLAGLHLQQLDADDMQTLTKADFTEVAVALGFTNVFQQLRLWKRYGPNK
jgi:hypothetical protein